MKVAEERIHRLFRLAGQRFAAGNQELADRYVALALEIRNRHNVKIPAELGRKVCGGCSRFLRPGANAVVRLRSTKSHRTVRCMECGEVNRYGY